MAAERERDLPAVIGLVRDEPHEHRLARVQAHLTVRTHALCFATERVRYPRRERVLHDPPGGPESADELVGASRARGDILPPEAGQVAKGRRLRARLLEDVTEPEHARAGHVRDGSPDGPVDRTDRQPELLRR